MSDFAKNQLLKFGWNEGKGLGKNENGITKPIKVTLKSGLEGLGCKETIDAWWEKKYNNAVQNIQVDSSQDGATLSTVNDNWDLSKMKENKSKTYSLYPNFRKIAILCNGCLMQDNSTTSEEKVETGQTTINIPLPIEELHTTSNNEVMPNMATRPLCTSSAKLERIALQDQYLISTMPHSSYDSLLKYSPLGSPNTLRSIFSKYSLPEYSSSFKCTSVIKPRYAMLNKVNQASEKKEEEDEYETNNNTMLHTLRILNSGSKSRNRKFKKKLNNLMQQLNSCSIKESESKNDLVKDQFLRNVRSNRKKCLKAKGKLEYAQLIKKQDLESCTMKEDISKQARSQNEKEYRPVQITQLEMNDDTSSKEESYKPSHESLVKGSSTCVIALTRFEVSRHGDADMVSTKNVKNSLYFYKSKKKRRNKHKHNQRSKLEDVVKNIVNKRDIDFVAKALTEINLTEDVSAAIKKKSTQNHITPV